MIDIIIPAYNAHKTISKALLSICMQTVNDKINVYIIDDCSDHDYKDIINKFKDRINIIEYKLDKNSGPGVARQYGLDHSNGEYIYFLDADDMFIDIYSLETLLKNIKNNDIICGNVYYENYDNTILTISNDFSFQLHGKLYKRKYIDENKFQFNDSRNGEDNCFNRLLKIGTDEYSYINSDVLLYSCTEGSITNNIEDYCYNEVPILCENMLWMAEEADKRGFDEYKIIYELYNELIHFSNVYVKYFKTKSDVVKLKDSFNKLYKKINEYGIELKVSDKNDIIFGNIGDNDVLNMVEYLFFNLSKKIDND